jgi:hypothetical protein
MKWTSPSLPNCRRRTGSAAYVLALCMAVLQLALACLSTRASAGSDGYCIADGAGSSQQAESARNIDCGSSSLSVDARLPRPQDNDPYLSLLERVALQAPWPEAVPGLAWRPSLPLRPASSRPSVFRPQLGLLAHSSQVLC